MSARIQEYSRKNVPIAVQNNMETKNFESQSKIVAIPFAAQSRGKGVSVK